MLICHRNEERSNPHFSVRAGLLEVREHEGDTWPMLSLYLDRGELIDLCHTLHMALRRWDEHEALAAAKPEVRTELPQTHEPWCTDHSYDSTPSFCNTDRAIDERTDVYMTQQSYTGEPEIMLNIGGTLLSMTSHAADDLADGIEKSGTALSSALKQLAAATAVTA